MMNRFVTTGLVVALVALTPVCRADIYAYTDAAGTTHFSNVPDDARYRLIVRTPPVAVAGAETPAAPPAARRLARPPGYHPAVSPPPPTPQMRPHLLRARLRGGAR